MTKKRIKPPKNWEDPPASFERFERLAKGLMAVPKKELDKETSKAGRRKEQRRKKHAG